MPFAGTRRQSPSVLGAAGVTGLGLLNSLLFAEQLVKKQKRVLMIFLNGGMSQFESWDPKPGTSTGGPFQSIPTSIPGYRISELMPRMAACLHRHTAVIRSQLAVSDHNDATIFGGKPKTGPVRYPSHGSMIARELANPNNPGRGATFFFTLPVAQSDEGPSSRDE